MFGEYTLTAGEASIPAYLWLSFLMQIHLLLWIQNKCSDIIRDGVSMKLVTTVRLDSEDPHQLLALIEHFNYACNELSKLAFESRTFGWFALQRASYYWLRTECGLNAAQTLVAVRQWSRVPSSDKSLPSRDNGLMFIT